MSEARLRIAFEGPGVEDGGVDVRDLAPALMALGQLVQAAAKALNGDRAQTSVRFQEVSAGSFIADLSIVQSLGERLRELFSFAKDHEDGIEAAKGLADLLFKVGAGAGMAGVGLLQLLKFLKGMKPEKAERLADGSVSLMAQDGSTAIVSRHVEKLYSDSQVRKAAEAAARAAQSPGIERLRFLLEGDEASAPLAISSGDAPAFALPSLAAEPDLVEEHEQIMLLELRKVWLTGETQEWDFSVGGEVFTAAIEDAEFLKKVGRREVSFAAKDDVRARVRVRRRMTGKGLKIERTVLEVLDARSGEAQLRLL